MLEKIEDIVNNNMLNLLSKNEKDLSTTELNHLDSKLRDVISRINDIQSIRYRSASLPKIENDAAEFAHANRQWPL